MKVCESFTPQRAWKFDKKNNRVLLILLLTDDQYLKTAIENFDSVDRNILNSNVHALWHMPFHKFLPNNVSYTHSVKNYAYYNTAQNNIFITLNDTLMLPAGQISFHNAQKVHPIQFCHRKHNLSYSIANRYYTHQMLSLKILSDYDYFMKVDADVRAMKPIYIQPLLHKGIVFIHTSKFPQDNPLCNKDALKFAQSYCHNQWSSPHTIYYGNFIIGWLGLFTSPEVLDFSDHHWKNGWEYRWTDQTFWQYALLATHATTSIYDASYLRKERLFVHGRG